MEDTGKISDGFHTFDELYEHRHALFMNLCRFLPSWKSRKHSDGSFIEGWFIAGIDLPTGKSITYHVPDRYWDILPGAALVSAPEWDGHTSEDVLQRLINNLS